MLMPNILYANHYFTADNQLYTLPSRGISISGKKTQHSNTTVNWLLTTVQVL